ncbi:hypothetical protein R1sor_023845 [Riccia sorocarpa]|uniref:GTD-binding domain-containing protein n=1 Tax=Riccia sorocarpa TaxID=122646 RepID=A0ABD3GSW1_9MARC
MAWPYYAEDQVLSDWWMVSTLIRALGELAFGFVVLLCAAVWVLIAKLIRSSGLSLSCHSCQQFRRREAYASHKHLRPSFNTLRLALGQDMSSSSDECTHLSGCSCSYGNETENPAPPSTVKLFSRCHREFLHTGSSSSLGYHSCSSRLLRAEEGVNFQRLDSFSSDTADDDLDERSLRDASGKPSGSCVSECRLLNVEMNNEFPVFSKRPLKRKFAKVFPGNSSRDSSPRDQTEGFVDQHSSGIAKKSPADGVRNGSGEADACCLSAPEEDEDELEEEAETVSLTRKQTVVSDADDEENLTWEESSGNSSSHGSFAYIGRLPVNSGRRQEVAGRKTEGVASESQFGRGSRGNITSEWSGSMEVSHPVDEMEKGGFETNQADDDEDEQLESCGVEELREALRAERKALTELYRELEQERSASATAANETMAMITRLQEEKAAAQMECRQFQRMAEEKQLYDQEALAVLQDILVRRDQEVFRLEEEAKLYRQKLLALTGDDLDKGGVEVSDEGSERNSDFLLIERETLLLEGSEEWKQKKNKREEKLLAEIKEWVTAVNGRGQALPNISAVKEDEESSEKVKLSHKIGNLSIDAGRKNLLESFSSVGEENLRDRCDSEAGIGSGAAAAGYESFHHLMDTLRKEPRLRDAASLETLDKIEEKFEKQSRKGKVKNEEDLRLIWKNTLRSFGPVVGENFANTANKSPNKQELKGFMEDSTESRGLMSGIVRDAEANRAMEQKTISVLEYVWKFEEQLHQGRAKKLGRASSKRFDKQVSPTPESGLYSQVSTGGALIEFPGIESDREKLNRLSSDGSRLTSSRIRRHASEADGFQVKGEAAVCSRIAAEVQERGERPLRHEDEEQSQGSLVHDVYEMEPDSLDASTLDRSEVCSRKVTKSLVSNSEKLALGGSLYSPENDVYMDYVEDRGDRLRKPEPLSGYTLSERKDNGKGRFFSQVRTGRYVSSVAEDESTDQDCEWPASTSGSDHYAAQASVAQGAGGRTPRTPAPKSDDVMDQLSARLKALEADRQDMKQTINSLRVERAENGEMLREIAQHLREFRETGQKVAESTEQEVTLASAMKGILSFSRFRCSVQAQLNKLARVFLRNVDLGICHGDQHVGLCRLLQISPQQPIRVTRRAEAKAEEIVSNGLQEGSLYQGANGQSTLLSQQSWPLDARERAGTALSGWDY